MIDFGRDVCGDFEAAASREWLVTNGLGGYASGTVAGMPTRRYHGLLVAAVKPPVARTLLLAKLDETADYDGRRYDLFTNQWASGAVDPHGYRLLERFHLEGTIPVWTYAFGDALLEKRVWMQHWANTTYIHYTLRRGSLPLTLSLKALVNYRDHHSDTRGEWRMDITPIEHGLRVTAYEGATPLYLVAEGAEVTPQHDWYRDFFLRIEDYRGFNALDNNLYAGHVQAILPPGESFTLIASTESLLEVQIQSTVTPTKEGSGLPRLHSLDASPSLGMTEGVLTGVIAYAERRAYEDTLLAQSGLNDAPVSVRQLVLAADQFIVRRALPDNPDGRSVIAGYHWFGDWGRDTMIALPGLTLATGRPEVAATILRTFAHFVDQGMLPNRFPDASEAPEYNTVDATLWYFEAVRAYHTATGDDSLVRDLWPVLEDIIAWHRRGTRYCIHADPADGLLYAGEPGVQLTWMDARVDGREITPRIGKPVEINALWYNALRVMADFARRLGVTKEGGRRKEEGKEEPGFLLPASSLAYDVLADQVKRSFARFWSERHGYLYDVIDGPDGDDASLRPNQILAASLAHSALNAEQARAVVDVCARELLTSHGLRSLAQSNPQYIGHYGGSPAERDGAYHQGTVWAWLIGPFVSAHLRVYHDPVRARSFLKPLGHHLTAHCLGSISEIFDGDPPFTPRGAMAQAWSVAEVLRAYVETLP